MLVYYCFIFQLEQKLSQISKNISIGKGDPTGSICFDGLRKNGRAKTEKQTKYNGHKLGTAGGKRQHFLEKQNYSKIVS